MTTATPDLTGAMKEHVQERDFRGAIVQSTLSTPTEAEMLEAVERYQRGEGCDHQYVKDDPGFMYSIRKCVVCGEGLGAI